MQLKACSKCGQLFIPKGNQKICDDCRNPRMKVEGCLIEEAKGRCEEYKEGKCDRCLMPCAIMDWIGWRKVNED